MKNKPFSIAIDGPAGAGKSSVAKAVAAELNAMYLDTGAMYRAFGLYMLRRGANKDSSAIVAAVNDVDITVEFIDGAQHIFLGGEDVTQAIREPEVSMAASDISAVPEVRRILVARQREIAKDVPVVMDGRDIGTKVLPDADVKVFLTASVAVRARRRWLELQAKGQDVPLDQLEREIAQRDHNDSTRAASPLRKADDAVQIDSSDMTLDEVVEKIVALARAAGEGLS